MDSSQSFNQPPGDRSSSGKSPPVYQDSPARYPAFAGPSVQGMYPGQSVVAVQPAVFMPTTPRTNPEPLAKPMPEYTCYSFFTLLCCCFPLGTAALVYSLSTRSANYLGHRELAKRNSKTALSLNNCSLFLGILFLVLFFLYEFLWVKKADP